MLVAVENLKLHTFFMLFDFLATEVTNHKITAELINAIY
jgi:hypothetical protein